MYTYISTYIVSVCLNEKEINEENKQMNNAKKYIRQGEQAAACTPGERESASSTAAAKP